MLYVASWYRTYGTYYSIYNVCHILFICWFTQHMLHICIISSGICAVQTALTRHLQVVLLFSTFSLLLDNTSNWILLPLVCMQTTQRFSGTRCVQPILSTDGGTITCFSRLWENSWANYSCIFLLSTTATWTNWWTWQFVCKCTYILHTHYIYIYNICNIYYFKFIFRIKADLTKTKEMLVIGNGIFSVWLTVIFGACPLVTCCNASMSWT